MQQGGSFLREGAFQQRGYFKFNRVAFFWRGVLFQQRGYATGWLFFERGGDLSRGGPYEVQQGSGFSSNQV